MAVKFTNAGNIRINFFKRRFSYINNIFGPRVHHFLILVVFLAGLQLTDDGHDVHGGADQLRVEREPPDEQHQVGLELAPAARVQTLHGAAEDAQDLEQGVEADLE